MAVVNRIALLALLAAGCGPGPKTADYVVPYVPPPPAGPLDVGDTFPPLQAAGWLNGPPPAHDDPGVKLLLVDMWGAWCPFCRGGAPGLVRLHKKYSPLGVAFVSATNTDDGASKWFSEKHSMPWANGYGVPSSSLVELGASSGMTMLAYGVAPVIYLVNPAGKIVWTDRQARHRHVETKQWEQDLDAAIQAALPAKP